MLRLIGLGLLAASMASGEGAADDAAIREVVKTYLAAREQKDEKLLASVFTADVDQLVSSGEWRRGRASLVEGTMASSAKEAGKRTVEIETIRYVAKDVAVADGRYVIAGAAEARRMWSTFVMKREAGGWRIAAIRNMLPARRW
jgi:uncharacterized protein (TIGR02246 family)